VALVWSGPLSRREMSFAAAGAGASLTLSGTSESKFVLSGFGWAFGDGSGAAVETASCTSVNGAFEYLVSTVFKGTLGAVSRVLFPDVLLPLDDSSCRGCFGVTLGDSLD